MMPSRRLALLCIGLLGAGLVLAQQATYQGRPATADNTPGAAVRQTFVTDDMGAEKIVPPESLLRDVAAGEDCPAGSLYGQDSNPNCGGYYYSDLNFCNPTAPTQCGRVRYENFPPPGVTAPATPIGVVTWRGAFADLGHNGGVDKPGATFRIQFMPSVGGAPDLAHAYAADFMVPLRVDTGTTVTFQGGTIPCKVWQFTAVLTNTIPLTAGWFSLTCVTSAPNGAVHLWEDSAEGDNIIYEAWESVSVTPVIRQGTCEGVNYCFAEKKIGACCFDCGPTCQDDSNHIYCGVAGGRFTQNTLCSAIAPTCGNALGACMQDTGACTEGKKCSECQTATIACCFPDQSCQDLTPLSCAQSAGAAKGTGTTCATSNCANYCIGDMNCDGTVGFGDINPFVLYLSNRSAWQVAYPTCDPKCGDINCDGTLYSFGDINPFVALLSQQPPAHCPHVCPAPAPDRAQGPVWVGPNTTCADACVVVAGTPTEGETQNCLVTDTYDGGCFATTPAFKAITVPLYPTVGTIYGQSGTFAASPYRDEDWYSYTSAAPSIFTMTVRAEFSPNIFVVHAGSDGVCLNWWQTDAGTAGDPCTDVTLVTHCLPAGKYYFLVRPLNQAGVACGSDYKLDITYTTCVPYAVTCTAPDHPELSACNDDPNHTSLDENGGCPSDPNAPVDPNAFELLGDPSEFPPNTPYVFCGSIWANNGYRDLDYYKFTLTKRGSVAWDTDTEISILSSMEFTQPTTGTYGPPVCGGTDYFWVNICPPGVVTTLNQPSVKYPLGEYWFLVMPQVDPTFAEGLFFGYPCAGGNTQHNYKVTMTYTPVPDCPDPCTDPSFSPNLTEAEPVVGPNYVDTYNSGCDEVVSPPGPTIPIALNLNNDYCSTTGSWLNDPNDPNSRKFDYDWYAFTTPATPPNSRWSMYLYGMTPMTWEIWPATTCAGPIEGAEMPACYTTAVKPAQCYPANTTYWLRVYPSDATASIGDHYYLAMFSPGSCTVCNINCTGATDNDNPCDDVNDYDTNFGCNGDPNGTYVPTAFLNYSVGTAYCGRSYAKQATHNGVTAGYYDPDWFKINLTAITNLEIQIQAEFPCFVGLYAAGTNVSNPSCANYNPGDPKAGTVLGGTGYKLILTSCSGTNNTKLDMPALPVGVYVGVIYSVDPFGGVLTSYYPCDHFNKYWLKPVTYVP